MEIDSKGHVTGVTSGKGGYSIVDTFENFIGLIEDANNKTLCNGSIVYISDSNFFCQCNNDEHTKWSIPYFLNK